MDNQTDIELMMKMIVHDMEKPLAAAGSEPEAYLRSGSNELKILEYKIAQLKMGINILKVSRVLDLPGRLVKPGTRVHPAVIGLFTDHGHIIPLVDLGQVLGLKRARQGGRVIVSEFFDAVTGFLVDSVEKVHTLLWERVKGADEIMCGLENPYVLAVARPSDRHNILMMDYEKIVLEMAPGLAGKQEAVEPTEAWEGFGQTVLIAEDSTPVREMLKLELEAFDLSIIGVRDGEKAVAVLEENADIALVIADVEMPKKDGLALLAHIRQHPVRGRTPVLIYSSIGDIGMKERAKVLEANGHITKLDMNELLKQVKKMLQARRPTGKNSLT